MKPWKTYTNRAVYDKYVMNAKTTARKCKNKYKGAYKR